MPVLQQYPSEVPIFVDGEWICGDGRAMSPVLDPSTGQTLGQLTQATASDVARAIASAHDSFGSWSATSAWERDAILQRAAHLINERKDHLAALLTQENGKPFADALGELDRVIDTLRFCGEEAKRAYGRIMPSRSAGLTQLTVKQPIGPVGAFVPWNFPAVLAIRKVAAALAAGCTVVLKPAEECPAICVGLVQVLLDAGLPAGCIQLLYGDPAAISEQVIAAPEIRKISFTGSVVVGKLLAEQAGRHLKPVTMELGGHAPVVVFDDVDVDAVAQMCVSFKFRNAGQVCLSPSRFYVAEGIAERFTEAMARGTEQIRVGAGFESGVQMGPLNNARRLGAAERLVQNAVDLGA